MSALATQCIKITFFTARNNILIVKQRWMYTMSYILRIFYTVELF